MNPRKEKYTKKNKKKCQKKNQKKTFCVCVCSTLSLLYRLLFCNDLKKTKKKTCFFDFVLIPLCMRVCACVCLVLLISFSSISFLFCLPEIKISVFGLLDLTAQPFLFGLAHKKTKLCSLPVCAFFSENIHLKCFFSFLSTQKKNMSVLSIF